MWRRRHHVIMILALGLTGCGSPDAARIADLEAESASLRGQLATTTTQVLASTTTTVTATTVPPSASTNTTAVTTSMAVTATTAPAPISVMSVTDGDTVRVLVDGGDEPLRLIGINAPEGGECLAPEATARLTELMGSGPIVLEPDVSDRDQYGRLLRHVHVADAFVNAVVVREGPALAVRYEPDTARAAELERAQETARGEAAGVWAPDACGPTGEGTIVIGHVRYDADGNDNHNLNDEWVELANSGSSSVDLTGWNVRDESASHRYDFPSGLALPAGVTLRLNTGCGTDTETVLHWCSTRSAVWNNDGDTVFVLDPNGNVVVSQSY